MSAGGNEQNVPVRMWESDDHLMVAAPMPGLQAEDISVTISGDTLVIRGEERGPAEPSRVMLLNEWSVGPYYRRLVLPEPVHGPRANASYGNGVLVLAMPRLSSTDESVPAEFKLRVVEATRGEHIGHTGREHQSVAGQR